MKIWIDISNAPHINFFKYLIADLEREQNTIVVTCRPLSNTISLLNLHKIKYTVIGKHYGKNIIKKILGYPIRVFQLYAFLKKQKIDVAISQSSFHSPLVARILDVPAIYLNDNEHAIGNIPAFICATKIMIPEYLNPKKVRKQGASLSKIISYPGIKEGIYLWQHFSVMSDVDSGPNIKRTIYIRPEPRTAQYYKGGENFLDKLIDDLKDKFPIIILTRDNDQARHYRELNLVNVDVPSEAISFNAIVENCILFIGAGGTMTREMAVIGIPTISVYQDQLLDVDRYLIQLGLINHMPQPNILNVLKFIEHKKEIQPNKDLLLKGQESYQLIKRTISQISKKC